MPPSGPRSGYVASVLARNRLGVASIVFFAVSAAAPLTVIAGGAVTAVAVTEVTAIPIGYLVIAVALAIFTAGYVTMSRHLTNAGAFYSYVAHGLGKIPGVGAAGIALLAYNAMQIGLYGAFGYVAAQGADTFGVAVPWWACALIGWALVSVLGLLDVALNGRVLATMLVAEVLIVALYDAVMLTHPAGGVVRWDTLAPSQLLDPTIAGIMLVAVAGFTGFEATVVFSEEAKDPKRTVARATYIAIASVGLLYGLSAWAISVATGPAAFVSRAKADGTELMFNLVLPYVGQTLVDIGKLLFMTSLLAALLVFHHTTARYCYALGRERVLPAAFGRVARRTGAPKVGSIAQSTLALVVIAVYAIAGWHPVDNMFGRLTAVGGLGVLILMALTSVAVVGFFLRDHRGEPVWLRVVAPTIAGLFLITLTGITVANFGALLNVESGSVLGWAFPAAYLVAGCAGLAWASILKRERPTTYARIGLGVETTPPATPAPAQPQHVWV